MYMLNIQSTHTLSVPVLPQVMPRTRMDILSRAVAVGIGMVLDAVRMRRG